MNVSAWSIRNPLVAVLLFILLSLGGWHGFHAMRVQQFPDMDFPVVVVSVALTGASPQQLESDVAKKVESRLASLDGVKNVRSTLQTGLSTTVIEFRLEKDLQEAVDEVRSAVGEIRSDLPADALDPVISKVGTSGMPLLTFSVAAQGMDALSLSWFVDDRLSRRLLGIPGVGSVSRVGGLSRTVEVLPDPVRLKALGLPISAVAAQVAALQRDVRRRLVAASSRCGRSVRSRRRRILPICGCSRRVGRSGWGILPRCAMVRRRRIRMRCLMARRWWRLRWCAAEALARSG